MIFYPRYLGEIVGKAWGYWSVYRQHKKILNECLQAPDRWTYSDLAIAPPREDELDSLELFSATRGGEMAVAKKRKEDAARTSCALPRPRTPSGQWRSSTRRAELETGPRRRRVGSHLVTIVSVAVGASPLMNGSSPADGISPQISLFRQAVIYAKEGSPKLVDGRWNLSQSEAKLGITFSADETLQLMACTGQLVCVTPAIHDEDQDTVETKVSATAVSVLRPDLLVTAKHVFFKGKKAVAPFGNCSFRSYSRRKVAIPVVVEKDQRRGYIFNNEDFMVLRLKRELEGCSAFAINRSIRRCSGGPSSCRYRSPNSYLKQNFGPRAGGRQGNYRDAFSGQVLGGPPFYYADIDLDVGGSGGAVFALRDGRPVADDEGRLILRGISVAYGLQAKSGKPYSAEQTLPSSSGFRAISGISSRAKPPSRLRWNWRPAPKAGRLRSM